MKRTAKILMMAALFTALCAAFAFADNVEATKAGIYDVTRVGDYNSDEVLTFSALKADKTAVSDSNTGGTVITVNNAATTNFFEEAEQVQFTLKDKKTEGRYYLYIAQSAEGNPTESTIQYINQDTAGSGSLVFSVYPKDLISGQTYYVYLSSNDGSSRTEIATFKYFMPYKIGYVDDDNLIDSSDAREILLYDVGRAQLTPMQLKAADVDEDGLVNSTDAREILLYDVGRASSLDKYYPRTR